jgi:hypothetical protein
MDAARASRAVGIPRDERAETVRTWPGLTAQAKLAHQYLYYERQRVGGTVVGQPGTVRITYAELGADQGTSSQSGQRALENLMVEGLVELIDSRAYLKTCYLADPLDAAIARRRAHEGDGQGVLFEAQEEPATPADEPKYSMADWQPAATESPPEGIGGPAAGVQRPPGPPGLNSGSGPDPVRNRSGTGPDPESARGLKTSARGLKTFSLKSERLKTFSLKSERLKTFSPKSKKTSDCDTVGAPLRRAQSEVLQSEVFKGARANSGSGPDPEPAPEAGPLAGVLEELLAGRIPSPAQQAAWIEELAAWIEERVGDAGLRWEHCVRVATAIVMGEYPAGRLVAVLRALDQAQQAGGLRNARWCYFVGAVKRSMREHEGSNR